MYQLAYLVRGVSRGYPLPIGSFVIGAHGSSRSSTPFFLCSTAMKVLAYRGRLRALHSYSGVAVAWRRKAWSYTLQQLLGDLHNGIGMCRHAWDPRRLDRTHCCCVSVETQDPGEYVPRHACGVVLVPWSAGATARGLFPCLRRFHHGFGEEHVQFNIFPLLDFRYQLRRWELPSVADAEAGRSTTESLVARAAVMGSCTLVAGIAKVSGGWVYSILRIYYNVNTCSRCVTVNQPLQGAASYTGIKWYISIQNYHIMYSRTLTTSSNLC